MRPKKGKRIIRAELDIEIDDNERPRPEDVEKELEKLGEQLKVLRVQARLMGKGES